MANAAGDRAHGKVSLQTGRRKAFSSVQRETDCSNPPDCRYCPASSDPYWKRLDPLRQRPDFRRPANEGWEDGRLHAPGLDAKALTDGLDRWVKRSQPPGSGNCTTTICLPRTRWHLRSVRRANCETERGRQPSRRCLPVRTFLCRAEIWRALS